MRIYPPPKKRKSAGCVGAQDGAGNLNKIKPHQTKRPFAKNQEHPLACGFIKLGDVTRYVVADAERKMIRGEGVYD